MGCITCIYLCIQMRYHIGIIINLYSTPSELRNSFACRGTSPAAMATSNYHGNINNNRYSK